MEAFHFGSSHKKLFGIYTPRSGPAVCDAAVLLCYPFGQEYMRAHMAYRQLATLLSRGGLPVMRFDYYATGDSYGEGHEALFSTWIENTDAALDELKAISGASHVYLVGLRLGALIAAKIAGNRKDAKKLVLWDPIVSGVEYLTELGQNVKIDTDCGTWWVNGYPISDAFRTSIGDAYIRDVSFPEHTRLLQIVSHESESFRSLANAFGDRIEQQMVLSPGDWNYADTEGSILLPHLLVRAIKDWLIN